MSLSRTCVGFSNTDVLRYYLMAAWKENEGLDFDFCKCELQKVANAEDEEYVKSICRSRIGMAETYAMLIGEDTKHKHQYVAWEAEVALERGCRIIGVNLDNWRFMNPATCPRVLRNVGAVFVPYSPQIVAHALEVFNRQPNGDWYCFDHVYRELGYDLEGDRAIYRRLPPPAPPELRPQYRGRP
jgi:MTH538 TIR-like domain (DUF1863)